MTEPANSNDPAKEEVDSENPPMDLEQTKCKFGRLSVDSNDSSPTKRVSTRSARRAKNQESVENGLQAEEHVELQEESKKGKGTALSNSSKQQAFIQIGTNYQAPPVEQLDPSMAQLDEDRDIQIWHADQSKVTEKELLKYLDEAFGLYGMHGDRAMYILQKADYALDTARIELESREILGDKWSNDEKILFRMAFKEHGKNFAKVKEVMPYRSMRSIVQYYYQVKKLWKDKDHYQDLQQVTMLDPASVDFPMFPLKSDLLTTKQTRKKKSRFFESKEEEPLLASLTKSFFEGICAHCGTPSHALRIVEMKEEWLFGQPEEPTEKKLCLHCSLYYEYTDTLPEVDETVKQKQVYQCPTGFTKLLEDFSEMATHVVDDSDAETSENLKTRAQIETKELRSKAEQQKARCLRMEAMLIREFEEIPDVEQHRGLVKNYKVKERPGRKREEWSEQEKYFATHAFIRYGINFEAVTEVVSSKTIGQVKKFYATNKKAIDKHVGKVDKVMKEVVEKEAKREERDFEERLKQEEARENAKELI